MALIAAHGAAPDESARRGRAHRRDQRLGVRARRRRRDHHAGRRPLERLPGLLHLDGRHRGAASGLRLRPQGAGAPPRRGADAHRAGQRAAVGRAFRPVEPGRPGHVPPRAGAGRRRRGRRPAMRGAAVEPRSRPASAISRPSSSWSGPASRRARRSTPPCSRPPARPKPVFASTSLVMPARSAASSRRACRLIARACGTWIVACADDDDRECHGQVTQNRNPLAAIPGTLVLVGAGKMGGACWKAGSRAG